MLIYFVYFLIFIAVVALYGIGIKFLLSGSKIKKTPLPKHPLYFKQSTKISKPFCVDANIAPKGPDYIHYTPLSEILFETIKFIFGIIMFLFCLFITIFFGYIGFHGLPHPVLGPLVIAAILYIFSSILRRSSDQ